MVKGGIDMTTLIQDQDERYRTAVRELTPRQKEVLALLSQGLSNSVIAQKLCLSKKTVNNYINQIYRELSLTGLKDIHHRAMAILIFLRYGTEDASHRSILFLSKQLAKKRKGFSLSLFHLIDDRHPNGTRDTR